MKFDSTWKSKGISMGNAKKHSLHTSRKPSKTGHTILFVPSLPSPVYTGDSESFMPLGLLALTASLRKHGYSSAIYKPSLRISGRKDYRKVARDILSGNPGSIGFSTWCVSYATSLLLAREIKAIRPDIPVIFGGPQASITGDITLERFPFVDYILKGEADHSLILLLSLLTGKDTSQDFDRVPGLIYRDRPGPGIRESAVSCILPDLDELPVPDYNLADAKTIKLDVGRGCPFRCTYCSTSDFFSRKQRVKPVERVIREMESCFEQRGTTSFGFSHDMFTTDKKWVLSLCKALTGHYTQKGRRFTWTCSARPDTVTYDLLKAMKEAGCQTIFFGVETGSPGIQKAIRKNLVLRRVERVAEYCSSLGIQMIASFMAGFPGEEEKDIDLTLNLLLKLIARGAKPQMSLLSVLPGTAIYSEHSSRLQFDGRFSDFSAYRPSREEVEMIRRYPDLFSSFYYLPVKGISRDNLYALSRLVNDLREFKYTSTILAGSLCGSLNEIPLIKSLIKYLGKYRKSNREYTELFFLIDAMNHLIRQDGQSGLPDYTRDMLVTETAKAVVARKFLNNQLSNPQTRKKEKRSVPIRTGHTIAVNPNWVQITTTSDILSLFERLTPGQDTCPEAEKNKEEYHYLVVAKSEKKSELFEIDKRQSMILEDLKDDSVNRILKKNMIHCSREELLELLNRLYHQGVIDVVN